MKVGSCSRQKMVQTPITASELVLIRHAGRIFRIPRAPGESDERAAERGWFMIGKMADMNYQQPEISEAWDRIQCESHIHVNTKRGGMKYDV